MQNYRSGDQVLLEIPAVVIAAMDGFVRVRFGDSEYDADPAAMVMIKRSMHLGDDVMHRGRDGVLAQSLEQGVFLVHFPGATGAEAYDVASVDDLQHAEKKDQHTPPASVPSPVVATPAPVAPPAYTPTPAPAAPHGEDTGDTAGDMLELTEPLAVAGASDEERRPAPAPGIGEMASSLSSVLGRGGQRRQPLDLESLGETQTVRDVRGEMVLDDDMRLKGEDD